MRDTLSDIVRQTSSLFEVVKVTGADDATKLEAQDQEKSMFLKATLKAPATDLSGEFGLGNLSLLNGLLNFSSYKTDDARFSVKRETKKGYGETVTEFQFRDANNAGSNYKTTSAQVIEEQAVIGNIPWEVTVEPSRAKTAEFGQLAALYADTKEFGVETKDTALVISLGDENATMHNATMVFAHDVTGSLKGASTRYNVHQFLTVLKMAGANPVSLRFSNRAVLMITIETEHATYAYYMRAKR